MEYGLALGGGAARGIAHIGVIKYILENNINITEISGTSMGAIMGACFALGMDSQKLTNILKEINFLKLIDLNLKDSIVGGGNKVYDKLNEIFGEELIENTKIPLKIVATNLNSGEKIIFTTGKIKDAVRASISLPGIFKPFEINNQKYIDGGLTSNLPVLEINSENIILSSAVRGKLNIKTHRKIGNISFKKWIFGNTYETIKKTISIIMKNNEDLNILIAKNNGKNIILLKPDLAKYEYFDFMKFEEITKIGYIEAKNILKDI